MVRLRAVLRKCVVVNRADFERAVRRYEAEKWTKGFSCWDQFVAMLFCRWAERTRCGRFAATWRALWKAGAPGDEGRAVALDLGLRQRESSLAGVIRRSSRDSFSGAGRRLPVKRRKFRFKNPLRSLDSTVIELCLASFDWARFRRAKGAIKLHLQLDHQGYLPCWVLVTEGARTI